MNKKAIVIVIIIGIAASLGGVYAWILFFNANNSNQGSGGNIKIDHNSAHLEDLKAIPESWIIEAKSNLHVVYWHTSHGSQVVDGMSPLDDFMNGSGLYTYNDGGTDGALDLVDINGADLSANLYNFNEITRTFLDDTNNNNINVVMWSWCALHTSPEEIGTYLSNMSQLELEYPGVSFVYMTGHLDGTGEDGPVHVANQMIRNYCSVNNKILYDFADIESYDPDDNYFLDLGATDHCDYVGGNWALEWQNTHTMGVHWYSCSCIHSIALNGNMKAYGAWNLFARLAGWSGP
ncbi:MAG: hypothetical protein JW891_09665 [Candidatus Lokiarchaeota archaeon]|nr:hypothetical protein [Candidatus Lokiarchaeota archaeon]